MSKLSDGKYRLTNSKIISLDDKNVYKNDKGINGYYYFEKYTNKQIETLKQLLLYWNRDYNISLDYNDGLFGINVDALSGKSGIWTINSFKNTTNYCHTCDNLIGLLKSIKNK